MLKSRTLLNVLLSVTILQFAATAHAEITPDPIWSNENVAGCLSEGAFYLNLYKTSALDEASRSFTGVAIAVRAMDFSEAYRLNFQWTFAETKREMTIVFDANSDGIFDATNGDPKIVADLTKELVGGTLIRGTIFTPCSIGQKYRIGSNGL